MSALAYRGSSCNRPAMIALKSSKIFGMTGVDKSRPHLYGEMHSRASKMIELRFGLNRNVVRRDKNSAREDSAEGPRRGGPAHDDRAGMARGVNMGSVEYENKASDSLERQNAAQAEAGVRPWMRPVITILEATSCSC
jgi:hypothetical protein